MTDGLILPINLGPGVFCQEPCDFPPQKRHLTQNRKSDVINATVAVAQQAHHPFDLCGHTLDLYPKLTMPLTVVFPEPVFFLAHPVPFPMKTSQHTGYFSGRGHFPLNNELSS